MLGTRGPAPRVTGVCAAARNQFDRALAVADSVRLAVAVLSCTLAVDDHQPSRMQSSCLGIENHFASFHVRAAMECDRAWWLRAWCLLLATACGAAEAPGDPTLLTFNSFRQASLAESASTQYRVWIAGGMRDIKVVCLPLTGDADLLVSFTKDASEGDQQVWALQGTGAEELLIRRDLLCDGVESAAKSGCYLYVTASAYETTVFQLGVIDAGDPFSTADCAAGCTASLLQNGNCDLACNVTSCSFDRGDCLGAAPRCAAGCELSWLDDGYCDEACFNAACRWDGADCVEHQASEGQGCADGCLLSYVDDGECDAACNVPNCRHDGDDCARGFGGCYTQFNGEDYRGTVDRTVSGHACQSWADQFPQQHFFSHMKYPSAGLGAHSYCRNPGGLHPDGPWCYTTTAAVRWERCDVPEPSVEPCGPRGGASAANQSEALVLSCQAHCGTTYAMLKAGDCEAAEECRADGAAGDEGAGAAGGGARVGGSVSYIDRGGVSGAGGGADAPDSSPPRRGLSARDMHGMRGRCLSQASPPTPMTAAEKEEEELFQMAYFGINASSPCARPRLVCKRKRHKLEHFLVIVWVSIAGTGVFVLALLVHAYRLTTPGIGSPRSWGASGYAGIGNSVPMTAAALPKAAVNAHIDGAFDDDDDDADGSGGVELNDVQGKGGRGAGQHVVSL